MFGLFRYIDPTKHLTARKSKLLFSLLHSRNLDDAANVFPRKLLLSFPCFHTRRLHLARLTHTLVRYKSKKNGEYRFAVLSAEIGGGIEGQVCCSTGTVVLLAGGIAVYKPKALTKSRVVKLMSEWGNATREGQFCEAMRMHAKVVDVDTLIMRRLPGRPLIDIIIEDSGTWKRGAHVKGSGKLFSVDQRVTLSVMIARAVMDVHKAGIIHRDIKGLG
jgi:serine/threonine protein kinase